MSASLSACGEGRGEAVRPPGSHAGTWERGNGLSLTLSASGEGKHAAGTRGLWLLRRGRRRAGLGALVVEVLLEVRRIQRDLGALLRDLDLRGPEDAVHHQAPQVLVGP